MPKVKGVVSYTYSFNGDPEVSVAAGAHHTASIGWAPASDGFYDLQVHARTRTDIRPAAYDNFFAVNGNRASAAPKPPEPPVGESAMSILVTRSRAKARVGGL
ncbi:hypothetical protein ACW4TU_26480 [Streptomyces sp. QTS52]